MRRTILMACIMAAAAALAAESLLINGAGATFPFPLYSKWFSEYNKKHPQLKFNYQSIGSGVHRSDGSGTTWIFTDYLAKVSPEWKSTVGNGKSVKWPVGIGGKGNEGVTGVVKQTPGAIGYVELAYANQNKLEPAEMKNNSGAFVLPSIKSTSEAAAGIEIPNDFRVSVTNASGNGAYPIAGFTYLLLHKDQKDADKGRALVQFLWWASHDGQQFAAPLDYAPLPGPVVKKVETTIKTLTVQGKPVNVAGS